MKLRYLGGLKIPLEMHDQLDISSRMKYCSGHAACIPQATLAMLEALSTTSGQSHFQRTTWSSESNPDLKKSLILYVLFPVHSPIKSPLSQHYLWGK